MKKLIITFIFLMFLSSTFAGLIFSVDGIYYETSTLSNTVRVVRRPGSGYYSGNIIIPTSVQNTVSGTTTTYVVTRIDELVFANFSGYPNTFPTSVILPNTITDIDQSAFYNNTFITTIILPSSLQRLQDAAFYGCTSLTSIVIPDMTYRIGDSAFKGCSSLKNVTCLATTPPSISENTFDASVENIYVPASSVASYKLKLGWKNFSSKIQSIVTAIETPEEVSYKIKTNDRNVEITNVYGKTIKVFNISGRKIFETSNARDTEQIAVNNQGVYIISIDNFKQKVMVY